MSDPHAAEADTRRNEALFRGLLESAPDAMVIVDAGARIVLVNAQTERLFGYRRDELVGEPVEVLLPGRLREVHRGHRKGYLSVPSTRRMGAGLELYGRRRDGSEFPVDVSLSPLETPEGLLVASAIRDVTERKRAEQEIRLLAEEAQRANAAKSELLSRMSHELRTPLNAIIGFGQLLELSALDAEQRESVGHIIAAGRHLLSLINEVLDISQAESGRFSLSLEPVRLEDVVAEAIELVRPLASERGVTVTVRSDADGLHVLADRQRLLQVVLNLAGNAVKYNRPDGRVWISWSRDGDHVRLEVADEGAGISGADLQTIFSPFERGGASHGKAEGTGLGLAVAKALVDAMGGTVGVESTPGRGSTFFVELAFAADDELRGPLAPAGGTLTLLHIEDNPTSRRLVQHVAARVPRLGVRTAATGEEGIRAALAEPPAVILLDLHLPDASGHDVLMRLRAEETTADTPIVVLSADTTRAAFERALEAGATDFLTKPIDGDRLRAILADYAARA